MKEKSYIIVLATQVEWEARILAHEIFLPDFQAKSKFTSLILITSLILMDDWYTS
jgi:hypothetical protein